MPSYRRRRQAGGTLFFTLVTDGRRPLFAEPDLRTLLHSAIEKARTSRPFAIDAIVLLPDHLHLLMTLPPADDDDSTRLAHLKSEFTRSYLAAGHAERSRSEYRQRTRRRSVWQPRFWEHLIRDADDRQNHLNYIHYNPVKHEQAVCPHAWPYSSFTRAVREKKYESNWCCSCGGRTFLPPDFSALPSADEMECYGE